MIDIGTAARDLREGLGLTQLEAAEALGITNVHLSNVETGKKQPSSALLARYREKWNIDIYVWAWCQYEVEDTLPLAVRGPAKKLADAMRRQINETIKMHGKKELSCCASEE